MTFNLSENISIPMFLKDLDLGSAEKCRDVDGKIQPFYLQSLDLKLSYVIEEDPVIDVDVGCICSLQFYIPSPVLCGLNGIFLAEPKLVPRLTEQLGKCKFNPYDGSCNSFTYKNGLGLTFDEGDQHKLIFVTFYFSRETNVRFAHG